MAKLSNTRISMGGRYVSSAYFTRLLSACNGLRSAAVTAYEAWPMLEPYTMLADIDFVDDTSPLYTVRWA